MSNSQVLRDTHISFEIKCEPDHQSPNKKRPLQRWVTILEISSEKEGLHIQINTFFSRKSSATKCNNTLINHLKDNQKSISSATDYKIQ